MKRKISIITTLVMIFSLLAVPVRASAASTITISGQVSVRFRENASSTNWKTRPLADQTVKIYDNDLVNDDLLATVKTDSNGAFSVSGIKNDDGWGCGGLDVYFTISAENEAAVVKDSLFHVIQYKSDQKSNVTGDVKFGKIEISSDKIAPAFNITDTILKGYKYFKDNTGITPGKITAKWYKGSEDGTHYSSLLNRIDIIDISTDSQSKKKYYDGDCWDKPVILHEYGHFLMEKYAVDPPGSGLTHNATMEYNPGLAYSEGWATFFGQSALGNDEYKDYSAMGLISYSIENLGAKYIRSMKNEASASAVLWDLYDGKNEPLDQVAGGFSNVADVFKSKIDGHYNYNMKDVWNNWTGKVYGKANIKESWEIFNNFGMQFDDELPAGQFEKLVTNNLLVPTTFRCEAEDNVAIDKIDFYVDNTLIKSVNVMPYEVTVDPANFSKGYHVIKARIYDKAGASAEAVGQKYVTIWQKTGKNSYNKVINGRDLFSTAYSFFSVNTGNDSYGVTPEYWDNIGEILTDMGKSFTVIEDAKLVTYDNIKNFNVLFLNCSPYSETYADSAKEALKTFVEKGGTIYASDWAWLYIDKAFSGKINFGDEPRIGDNQVVKGTIVDKGLANALKSDTLDINYNLGSWVVIDSVSEGTKVHITGDVNTYEGLKKNKPLLVSFPEGKGKVVYTTFHNEAQVTGKVEEVLKYFVLSMAQTPSENNILDIFNKFKYAQDQIIFGELDPNGQSQTYTFNAKAGYDYSIVADSSLGSFDVELTKPDGAKYETTENPMAPYGIDIDNAEEGQWQFIVKSKAVNFEKTPFVIGIGKKISMPSVDQEEKAYNTKNINITGSAPAADTVMLTVRDENDKTQNLSVQVVNGKYSFTGLSLSEGINKLSLTAKLGDEVSSEQNKEFTVDTVAPSVNINSDTSQEVYEDNYTLNGSISEMASVYVNGEAVEITANKPGMAISFDKTLKLSSGDNNIIIIAADPAGNKTEKQVTVERSSTATRENNAPEIRVVNLSEGDVINKDMAVKIEVKDESEYGLMAYMSEAPLTETTKDTFKLSLSELKEGENEFEVKAEDKWGNSSFKKIAVKVQKGSGQASSSGEILKTGSVLNTGFLLAAGAVIIAIGAVILLYRKKKA